MKRWIAFRIFAKIGTVVMIGFLPVLLLLTSSCTSPITWVFLWFFVVLTIVWTSPKPLKNQGTVLFICILTLLVLMMFCPKICAWYADYFRPSYLKCLSKEDKIIYYETDSKGISYVTYTVGIRSEKDRIEILEEIMQFQKKSNVWLAILHSEKDEDNFTTYLKVFCKD